MITNTIVTTANKRAFDFSISKVLYILINKSNYV